MSIKYKLLMFFAAQAFLFAAPVQANSPNPINHIFLRLDVETINEISKNEFLQNEFSDFYAGSVGDLKNKWTAVYIQGKSTYLELFDKNGSTTAADVGIAFGVDSKKRFLESMATLSGICTQPMICEIENRVKEEGGPVWFSQFKVIDTNDMLDTWVMVYDADYVSKKPTPKGSTWSKDHDVSRERYNSEWYKPERLLQDIVEVHLTVVPEHFDRILKIADEKISNMLITDVSTNPLSSGKGVDAVILQNGTGYIYLTVGNVTKVDKVVMSLNRDAGHKVYSLGKSSLEMKSKFAVWSFN